MSKFELIENDNAPHLRVPHFVVDHKIKEVEKPFPSVASYLVFCGKSRSGKSSLITSLLTSNRMYYRAFNNVIVCMPKHSFNSMKEEDNPYANLDPEKVHHEFNYETLEGIYQQIVGYSQEEEDTLLLIDDYASELKNGDLLKLLNSLVNNRRHLRLSIWMSVQTYRSIPMSNRKTINCLILFKCNNKAEINSIWEEMTFLSKEQFYDLITFVFQKPFDYLFIDRDDNSYWKKFSQIIIKDDQKENEKNES